MQETKRKPTKPGGSISGRRKSLGKTKPDWEAIEREYRAGQLPNAEIARQHGLTPAAITMRAKRNGWVKDLTAAVKQSTARKLVNDAVNRDNAEDKEIVEIASDRAAGVVRLHRKDISALRDLETRLIAELDDNPTKLYLAQYQGRVIEKVVGLTASDRAAAANNLANVQHKRIQLERQAFNIGDAGSGETIEDRLRALEGSVG